MNNINWEILGVIGQWLGAFATFGAVIVALKPYREKLDFQFTMLTNLENTPTVLIWNNSLNVKLIKELQIYNGKPFFTKKLIMKINYIDYIDDLISTPDNIYIKPGDFYKLQLNNDRIIHNYIHNPIKLDGKKIFILDLLIIMKKNII